MNGWDVPGRSWVVHLGLFVAATEVRRPFFSECPMSRVIKSCFKWLLVVKFVLSMLCYGKRVEMVCPGCVFCNIHFDLLQQVGILGQKETS